MYTTHAARLIHLGRDRFSMLKSLGHPCERSQWRDAATARDTIRTRGTRRPRGRRRLKR
jgi:hypothetical protein